MIFYQHNEMGINRTRMWGGLKMELSKILDQLLNSDHKSARQKQKLIRKFADAVCAQDGKGRTPVHIIAWKNDLQTLKDLLFLVEKFVPQIIPAILTKATEKNETVGHAIAFHKDKQALMFFVEFVHRVCPAMLADVLLATTKSGMNILHIVAKYKSGEELKELLMAVVTYCPEKLTELLDATIDDGRTIVHLIAEKEDPQILDQFLEMLRTYDALYNTNLFRKVLTSPLRKDWQLGFFIAENQNHDSVVNYLKLVEKYALEELPELLKATTSDGWHLGHFIAEYQSEETLSFYFEMVIKHSPDALADILNAREQGPRLLGILILDNKKYLGPLVYQLVTSHLPLGHGMYARLQCFKQSVLEHISRLPAQTQLEILPQCLDRDTPLGLYFDLKQDILHRHIGENHEYLTLIDDLLQKAKVESRVQHSREALQSKPGLSILGQNVPSTPQTCDYNQLIFSA